MNEETVKESKSNKKPLIYISVAIVIIGSLVFCWWFFYSRFYVNTEDAYVSGNQVTITSQIQGVIVSVNIDNTQMIEKGQTIIELDKTDREIEFDRSKSNLGAVVRNVTGMFENVLLLKDKYKAQHFEVLKMEIDYIDRKSIVDTGAVSDEEFFHSEANYLSSKAALDVIKHEFMRALSQVQNTTITTHPLTNIAKEELIQAWVNLQRCTIKAPVTGMVAQRRAQVGEYIDQNTPLMAIVPLNQMWVDANFKETQLSKIRIGQIVKMSSDIYGGGVIYSGEVIGIGGGSGAVFSPLPPQNATGNWIKIVQRIPVRVNINQNQLTKYPLRLGLSMDVNVKVDDMSGKIVPDINSDKALYTTNIFDSQRSAANGIIEEIFMQNITFDISNEINGSLCPM